MPRGAALPVPSTMFRPPVIPRSVSSPTRSNLVSDRSARDLGVHTNGNGRRQRRWLADDGNEHDAADRRPASSAHHVHHHHPRGYAFGRYRSAFVGKPSAGRDRKSVVSGKSVSVRVDLGGRRLIKKKNKNV